MKKLKEIVEVLNEQLLKSGKTEIEIATYDGGNDSGGITFDSKIEELIQPFCEESHCWDFERFLNDNTIDYGSWAGDFDANGTIYWNGKEFRTEGSESQTEWFDRESTFNPFPDDDTE